jgi:hypothetical protein
MFFNSNDNNKISSFQQTSCLHILISFGQSFWHSLTSLIMKQMNRHKFRIVQ